MIRTIQLYIGDDRIDLFKDENISITDSIKNAKDISKVFTTFSQQFTVPASKTNNKIFKHYYNFDIDSPYDFDAREKKVGRIELNHLPFKKGRIKLDGVDLRDNKPYAYRITFYGSAVDLKDLIGEDKLPILTAFEGDQKSYDIDSLISDLTQNATADYALALITASQRLYFDTQNSSQGSGNLYYDTTTPQGLKPQQLKYGVKLQKLIDAIFSQYSITRAENTFFNPSESNDLDEIYMWLHRKKGTVDITAGDNQAVNTFNPSDNINTTVIKLTDSSTLKVEEDTAQVDVLRFITTTDNDEFTYDIVVERDTGSGFEILQTRDKIIGGTSLIIDEPYVDEYKYKVYIRTYESIAQFSELKWQAQYINGGAQTDELATTNQDYAVSYYFVIKEHLPEMKIIDFLSGMFQLFNLVAYIDQDDKLVTQTLDEFYRTGGSYDISQYVDISKSAVNAALPYKEIFFKYKDTKTILAEQHLQEISDVEWGGVEYTDEDIDASGGIYKVEPPFNHTKYEKLLDTSNTSFSTDVQVGYFVTDNEEAYLGAPLLYYIVPQTSNVRLSYVRGENLVNSPALQGTVNMPSNSKSFDANVSEENIHFNPEFNEFTGTEFDDTLFKRYYEKYITSVFNRRNRLTRVTAYLPVKIMRELDLSDTIIINGRSYIINSMNMNLNTGKTEFELLNKYTVSAVWNQIESTWSTTDDNWGNI
jgi:hypothetical protein